MTLEQVREEMDAAFNGRVVATQFQRWRHAIDAEIKSRGEPVAFRSLMPIGNAFTWTRWLEIVDINLHSADGLKIEYAYTAPPAPKVEVTIPVAKRAIEARNAYLQEHPGDAVDAMVHALEAALKETP